MGATWQEKFRLAAILSIVTFALAAGGCSGDDGDDGNPGPAGTDGSDGINCWDLNGNGIGDLPDEDLNGDGVVDVLDCNAIASGGGDLSDPAVFHKTYFSQNDYTGTQSCLNCHGGIADDVITTGHWNWEGVAAGITGFEGDIHGKTDIVNNFCVAIATNEGRCTQCHIGYNWDDANFDFGNTANVDCLVCHDKTGTYAKAPTTAGNPDPNVDLTLVAQSVGEGGGVPNRDNCIDCHAKAGGGDNVKHGDIALSLANTTREFDVHMGTDGGDLSCVACHGVQKDSDGNLLSHGIGGMVFHSVDEGDMKDCVDCHGDRANIHAGLTVEPVLNIGAHDTLACQVCHIPTFARNKTTKVEWYWADAGDVDRGVETDPVTGDPIYDPKKGTFVWANNVRPSLLYYDGKWDKALVGVNDVFPESPAVLAAPSADYTTPGAMIYPFKKMIGNQPFDANNDTVLVPHLFGPKGGENPYWGKYDWNLALQDGAAATGQPYSGSFEFRDTVMYLTVNHEVAPSEQAYGMDGACSDCHGGNQFDWTALGWTADPVEGGTRP